MFPRLRLRHLFRMRWCFVRIFNIAFLFFMSVTKRDSSAKIISTKKNHILRQSVTEIIYLQLPYVSIVTSISDARCVVGAS